MSTNPIALLRTMRAGLSLLVLLLGSMVSMAADPCAGAIPKEVEEDEELLVTEHPVGRRGGRLVTALRAEPKTFNPVIARDNPSHTVIRRLMADLIHINRFSQETEPALARSWRVSDDGRRYSVELRRGLHFSDGHSFDADDVLFSFEVLLDQDSGYPYRDLLIVGGEPLKVHKKGPHSVEVELAEPYGAGDRLFDNVPILPEHVLAESYRKGKIGEVWGLATPPQEIVGLGPFKIKEYIPGVRCVLERNPHYWKADREGSRLPYLDELVFLFVASDDAQVVRFQSGDTDMISRLSAQSFLALDNGGRQGRHEMIDLGPGLDYNFLFFNLNDASDSIPPEIARKQKWFEALAFRRAVSAAIDREGILRLVYRSKATPLWSNVSPGDKRWVNKEIPKTERSIERARRYLKEAGFMLDASGRLTDSQRKPVEFSIITNSSNGPRLDMAAIIQDDLKQLGMQVRVVPLEMRNVVERLTKTFDFEGCIFGFSLGDADPNAQLPMLVSHGGFQAWNLSRDEPSTPWEVEVNRLMRTQLVTVDQAERKKLYDRVQQIMAEQLPFVFLTSPHVLVGAKSDLGNYQPAVLSHPNLWNVEQLYWKTGGSRVRR